MKSDSKVIACSECRRAVVHALAQERSSLDLSSVGEEPQYEDYSSRLILLTEQIASRTNDPLAYDALVNTSWNPGSQVERWLALRPEAIAPTLEMLNDPSFVARGSAVYLLADLLKTHRTKTCLHEQDADSAKWNQLNDPSVIAILRAKVKNENDFVRCNAIRGLGLVGTKSDEVLFDEVLAKDSGFKYLISLSTEQIESGKSVQRCPV
jgi:HEAT repeat protein